jgi:SAM-dependent methyltransferase
MDDISKEFVISFFNRNLSLHGDRPEAVRWTAQGQRNHYEALLDIGDLQGKKVLDFGCGKGDLYGFLMERGISTEYCGCDINADLIAAARRNHPLADFRVFDIEQEDLAEDFDYILLCGVFNLKVCAVENTVRNVLARLYPRCRLGLGFNALSAHNPQKDFELSYLSPEEMFRFAVTNLSPFVSLRQDRIPFDFMLFVYREPQQPR